MSDELYETERATLHSLMDTAKVLNGDWPRLAEWQKLVKAGASIPMMPDKRWRRP